MTTSLFVKGNDTGNWPEYFLLRQRMVVFNREDRRQEECAGIVVLSGRPLAATQHIHSRITRQHRLNPIATVGGKNRGKARAAFGTPFGSDQERSCHLDGIPLLADIR